MAQGMILQYGKRKAQATPTDRPSNPLLGAIWVGEPTSRTYNRDKTGGFALTILDDIGRYYGSWLFILQLAQSE